MTGDQILAIVREASERPWTNGADPSHFDAPEVTNGKTFAYHVARWEDAVAIAVLVNHAEALAGLMRACEEFQRWSSRDARESSLFERIESALGAVHAVRMSGTP